MLEIALLIVFPLGMFYAAASDMLSMKISNNVTLILIGAFIVLSLAIGMDWQTIALHWAVALLVLFVGFGFFAAGWVGGGDVKLATAGALWLGWEFTLQFIALAGFIGGLLTIALLVARSKIIPMALLKIKWISRLMKDGGGVPYGIALGPAAIFIYPDSTWMQYVFKPAG